MIYIQTGYTADPNNPRIGWQSLAYGLTPTASTSAAGFPAVAATYPTTFEFWKPTAAPATWAVDLGSAKPVDYVGVVADLAGATVAIQWSADGTTWTTVDTRTPTDRINVFLFSEVAARYWRLSFTGALPSVAVVYFGKALTMPRMIYQGHTPLTLSRQTELSNNVSDGGQYLGRSIIRKGASTGFGFKNLKADWYRANFDQFVKAARTMPFFVAWRPVQFPTEMGFVWVDGDISPSNSGPRDYMSVDISVQGLINE